MAERFISTSQFPSRPVRKMAVLEDLSGGLNLRELDYRLDANESPEMKNLWWCDGLLSCRDGQEYVAPKRVGEGFCCYESPFWGYLVAHIADGLYAAVPGPDMVLQKLCGGLPRERGTFVRYQDALLYKTRGAYKKILWNGKALEVTDVTPYVPVTVINCTYQGSGDLYQPENRLSAQKTVWFNAARTVHSVSFEGKSLSKVFTYKTADGEPVASVEQVYNGTTLLDAATYKLSEDLLTLTLNSPLKEDAVVTVVYTVGVRTYQLPVSELDSIDEVIVDDAAVTDYTADLEKGMVTFAAAPPMQEPAVNNTVKITYSKKNEDAYNAIMDCRYAAAYGGTGGAVLVFAGSTAQPNAYFWNGGHVSMDMGYFPLDYYNLAGDNLEPVTGFGQQAGYLMVFKQRAVGKCLLSSTTIDERAYLALDYTPVSVSMGCDLPWTIRTVENNLVWCSTYAGVCRLEDTNEALENRVRCISRNVLGCDARPGLLRAVRDAETVCALDDGSRYWVAADGQVFLWDYAISSASKPSWFYFTGIPAVAFFKADALPAYGDDGLSYTGAQPVYHLDAQGRISRFVKTYRDYGGAIEKVYRFAARDFGDLERQKHIRKIILATRCDSNTVVHLQYQTDHTLRSEPIPIRSYNWRLLPRDLSFRFLGVKRFAHVAVRVPGCRYVRYFSLRMENSEPGCDMSPVRAEFHAEFVIEER